MHGPGAYPAVIAGLSLGRSFPAGASVILILQAKQGTADTQTSAVS